MKTYATLLLILFVTFLATPTIVSLIENKSDVSNFYSCSEEEISSKDLKEIKAELKHVFDYPFIALIINTNSTIISETNSLHDKITPCIFSPPPELS